MIYFFGSQEASKGQMKRAMYSLCKATKGMGIAGLIMLAIGAGEKAEAVNGTLTAGNDFKITIGSHTRGEVAGTLTYSGSDEKISGPGATGAYMGTPSLNALEKSLNWRKVQGITQGGNVVAWLLPMPPMTFGVPSNQCQVTNYLEGCISPDPKGEGQLESISSGSFIVVYSGANVEPSTALSFSPYFTIRVKSDLTNDYAAQFDSVPPDFMPTSPPPACTINGSSTTGEVPLGDVTYTGAAGDAAVSQLGQVNISVLCTGDPTTGSAATNVGVTFKVGNNASGSSRYAIPDHTALSIVGRQGDTQPSSTTFCNSDESNIVKTDVPYPLGKTSDSLKDTETFSKVFWWGVCENTSGEPGSGPFSVAVTYDVAIYN